MWARICVLGSAVCLGIILNLALAGEQRIILPHLGVVRPVVGLVTLFLTFFISSHQVFRWMVRICMNAQLVADECTKRPHSCIRRVAPSVSVSQSTPRHMHQRLGCNHMQAVVVQPVFVASGVYSSAEARTQIDCLADGSCTTTSGFDSSQLALMEVANLVGVFFQVRGEH